MSLAWTCLKEPTRHGSFLQSGLDTLSALYGALQPSNRRGCPICIAHGDEGYMRPASETEVGRLSHQLERT